MKIGITFAVFNRIDLTLKCLESMYKNESKHDLFIVVVNNGSTDGTVEKINSSFPEVKIISNVSNKGCAIAWNQGLNRCLSEGCDFLVLTQNDVIISKGSIDRSVGFLKTNKHEIKVVSPIAINVSFASGKNLCLKELNYISEKAREKYKGSIHRFFCMYYFMMLPGVFELVKFDENFKRALYEDSDFYDNLSMEEIKSCGCMDVGLLFHRYNATQIIARNSDPHGNKRYFEEKWKDKKEILHEKVKKILEELPLKMDYPVDQSNIFLDVEKAGLHKW